MSPTARASRRRGSSRVASYLLSGAAELELRESRLLGRLAAERPREVRELAAETRAGDMGDAPLERERGRVASRDRAAKSARLARAGWPPRSRAPMPSAGRRRAAGSRRAAPPAHATSTARSPAGGETDTCPSTTRSIASASSPSRHRISPAGASRRPRTRASSASSASGMPSKGDRGEERDRVRHPGRASRSRAVGADRRGDHRVLRHLEPRGGVHGERLGRDQQRQAASAAISPCT